MDPKEKIEKVVNAIVRSERVGYEEIKILLEYMKIEAIRELAEAVRSVDRRLDRLNKLVYRAARKKK